MVRDPETGRTEGPHDLVTWGHGAIGQDHICLSATSADNPLMTCLVGIPYGPKELPTRLLEITEQANREGSSKGQSGQERSYQFVYQTKDVYTAKIWCGRIAHVEMASTADEKPLTLPKDVFLICGDRAWAGIPPRLVGGPCTFGRFGLFSPNKTTLMNWQQKNSTRIKGYKNSPTVFGEQLAKDLESWEPPPGEGQLLQYVDDLLIATQTQETCVDRTVSLLNFLGLQGYRVSQKKAQMVRQTVIYLGYEVSARRRTLGQDRKEAICQTPKPQTVKELRTFLGMAGWCRLWIYNYGLLVKPLNASIMEGSRDLQWTKEATRAFDQLKKALMSAPSPGLPDVSKPFFLLSHKKQGIALGILAQNLGPYRRAVAYLSKQLDTAAKGWPGCLRAVAAVAINIQEACKLTLGQKMTVLVSHTMSAVLGAKGGHWLSPQRFLNKMMLKLW
ncbi:hypothetical protein DUI87_01593 [Hirundo rustica rustica]|uniref:ribonuclease H n=1 Tax=Hirundo rustica rustica TaxID=333673 RepID=A0A3M0L6K5_HIRRU|nr:hypothetical protein DUI87_01593 [Hirundo rustica rustica]